MLPAGCTADDCRELGVSVVPSCGPICAFISVLLLPYYLLFSQENTDTISPLLICKYGAIVALSDTERLFLHLSSVLVSRLQFSPCLPSNYREDCGLFCSLSFVCFVKNLVDAFQLGNCCLLHTNCF